MGSPPRQSVGFGETPIPKTEQFPVSVDDAVSDKSRCGLKKFFGGKKKLKIKTS